jgi:hypothetical protein
MCPPIRWETPDPASLPWSNLRTHARGAPTTLRDLTGLAPDDDTPAADEVRKWHPSLANYKGWVKLAWSKPPKWVWLGDSPTGNLGGWNWFLAWMTGTYYGYWRFDKPDGLPTGDFRGEVTKENVITKASEIPKHTPGDSVRFSGGVGGLTSKGDSSGPETSGQGAGGASTPPHTPDAYDPNLPEGEDPASTPSLPHSDPYRDEIENFEYWTAVARSLWDPCKESRNATSADPCDCLRYEYAIKRAQMPYAPFDSPRKRSAWASQMHDLTKRLRDSGCQFPQ